MIDWIKQNKRLSAIIGGGIVLNLVAYLYVVYGLQPINILKQETTSLATSVASKQSNVPSSSQLLTLADQADFMKQRKGDFRELVKFEFPKSEIEGVIDEGSPRDVTVRDRVAKVRKDLTELFREEKFPLPKKALGLPETPDPGRFMDQLRRIYLVKELYRKTLKNGVLGIKGIYTGDSVSLPERLEKISGVTYLSEPLQLRYSGTTKQVFRVLFELQQPGSYLQILDLDISTQKSVMKEGGNPVLNTRMTIAPIQTGPGKETEKESDNDDSDEEEDDGSDINNIPW